MSDKKRWDDWFQDPDMVGATEYLAIHDAIKDCSTVSKEGAFDFDQPLDQEQIDHIKAMLEEFRDHARVLLVRIGP